MHTRLLARAQRRHALLNRIASLDAERADLLRRFPELSTYTARRRFFGGPVAAEHPNPQERPWLDSLRRH